MKDKKFKIWCEWCGKYLGEYEEPDEQFCDNECIERWKDHYQTKGKNYDG